MIPEWMQVIYETYLNNKNRDLIHAIKDLTEPTDMVELWATGYYEAYEFVKDYMNLGDE